MFVNGVGRGGRQSFPISRMFRKEPCAKKHRDLLMSLHSLDQKVGCVAGQYIIILIIICIF